MNAATRSAVLIAAVTLTLIYIFLLSLAWDGFGQAGYHGYSSRAFFNTGDVETYHERSARGGSPGGVGVLGGGPEGGK